MDSELAEDLEEALDGVDPVEFLLADPALMGVAEEMWGLIAGQNDNDRFEDVTTAALAVDVDCKWTCNAEESSSGGSSEAAPSPESSSRSSPWSDAPSSPQQVDSSSKKCMSTCQGGRTKGALCVTCDQPARGFKYYSVVVCNSCRAFFARSIKGNGYKDFMCANGDNSCKLNSKSWVACQKCRFERCLKVGMKIPGNKRSKPNACSNNNNSGHFSPGQDNMAVIRKNDTSCVCGGYGESFVEKAKRLLEPADTWTVDEKLTMEDLITNQGKQGNISFANLIRSRPDIFEASMRFFFEGKSYPLKMQKVTENYMLYLAKDNPEAFQGFQQNRLTPKDASRLVLGNFPIVSEYVNAYNMNKKKGYKQEVQGYIKALIAQCQGDAEFKDRIEGIVSKVSKNGELEPLDATYNCIYSREELGLLEDKALADRHYRVANKLATSGILNEMDVVQCILTVCVMMYSSDFIELDEPSKVQEVQMTYANLLQRYLKSKEVPYGDQLFMESMMASSYARELREIRLQAYRRLKL